MFPFRFSHCARQLEAFALSLGLTLVLLWLLSAVLIATHAAQARPIDLIRFFKPSTFDPTVIATVTVGSGPVAVGVNPVTNRIYVANNGSNNVSVIDGVNNIVVATVPVASPDYIGVNPTINRIYVGSYNNNIVSVIDGISNTIVATVTVGPQAGGLGINPAINHIYVTNFPSNTLMVIDGASNTVVATVTTDLPYVGVTGVGVNPITNRIYVAKKYGFDVTVIDGVSNTIVSTVPMGTYDFFSVVVNPLTNRVYALQSSPGTLWVIDGISNTVVASVTLGSYYYGSGINTATNRIYVTSEFSNTVTAIDGATNIVVATATVGSSPVAVGVNQATSRIYVANSNSNTVSVLQDIYPEFILTVNEAGTGAGTVSSDPAGLDCGTTCSTVLIANSPITLTATPLLSSTFMGWSGAAIGSNDPIVVTMTDNTAITASFALNQYIITPTAGANGSLVPSTPQTADYGASQTYTITPSANHHIVDVGVDGLSQGAITSYTFGPITANHTISAAFAINASVITQTYVIAATGPSQNNMSVHLTGSNGAGAPLQIVGGGIYGGDGGHLYNVDINGTPPAPVDLVGGCNGNCTISGNAVVNFNAAPLPVPPLYDIADFQPGGVYAVAAGSNFYQYTGNRSFSGVTASGLYYIDGNVTLHNVTGAISIVATGDIYINGDFGGSTYDPRFPLLFTVSNDVSIGAIASNNPSLGLTGDFYAPNGAINIAGARGLLRGRVYAKEISWDASSATITCPDCNLSWPALSLQKSVTPTVNVPYHGVVTYTNVLHNRDLVSDTYVLFTDTLPAGVTFSQWIEQPIGVVRIGDNIAWTGYLSASTSLTLTFTTTHAGGYGDVITNTAYFSSATNTGNASAAFAVIPIYSMLTIGYAGTGGGQVMLNPSGPNYAADTVVTLTAVPSITSQFSGWSGNVITTANPITLTLDADRSVTATFTLKTFVITPTAGANGSIIPSTPQTIDYGASRAFTVTSNSNYHIVDVDVDGVSHGPIGFYTFDNITAHHIITATFAINTFTMTLHTAGNGSGSVIATPSEANYAYGSVVTLTAVPGPASRFTGWSGNIITTTNPLVLGIDSDKTITATFAAYRIYLPLVRQ